jgi:hypothetical protein
MNDFIEQQIIEAVKKLLSGRVNEIIAGWQSLIPVIEFGSYESNKIVNPSIALAACEQTEKERIIRLDVYLLTVCFSFQDEFDSELYCYAYSAAARKALNENNTLGGIANRVVISDRKYQPPKSKNCGEGWALTLTLRVTVENLLPCRFST